MEEILKALRLALGLAENAEVTVEMIAGLQPKGSADESLTKKANNFSKLSKLSVVSLGSDAVAQLVPEGTEEVAETVATEMVVLKKVDFEQLKSTSSTLEELKIGETQATKEGIATLQAEAAKVPTLTTEVEGLKAEKATLEPLAAEGTKYLNAKKDEAIRLYKIQAGDAASEAVVQLFKDAKADALDGLLSQYTKGLAAKFSGKCGKCGSEEFEFRSSLAAIEDNAGNGDVTEAPVEDVSFNALHSKFDKSEIN